LVDYLTGIVRSVFEVEINRYDPDVFVAAADASPAYFPDCEFPSAVEGSGAGLTSEAARWAAVGEAVERYALGSVCRADVLFGSPVGMRERGYDPVGAGEWVVF